MSTINISLPETMYQVAKKTLKERGYTSMSELIRDSLRKTLYEDKGLTENGFPKWFEDRVLESAAQPPEQDIVLETKADLDRFFQEIHQRVEKRRHGKG